MKLSHSLASFPATIPITCIPFPPLIPKSRYSKCTQDDLSSLKIWLKTVREGKLFLSLLRFGFEVPVS